MRSIVLSNGELCVALDDKALVRDIYYPHVGLEDHVRGHYVHRVGVWVDGRMSWFNEDPEWHIEVGCEDTALASHVVARHDSLGVELTFTDLVYNERPIFVRRVSVTNKGTGNRVIKLYFAHQFEIYKSHGSDTAYFDPATHSIIHYKGHRVFSIGGQLDNAPFEDYATGRSNFQGREGSHRDADDGSLSKNPIEHGPADSVIGLYGSYAPGQSRAAYYWICAAQSIDEAKELTEYLVKKTPEHLIKSTLSYWHAWVNASDRDYRGLTPSQIALFKKSLLYVRAAVDQDGGIIASLDSDMLQYGLDTYSYVWPRDGAYCALALDMAGDANAAERFFQFCRDTITSDGYFMHKYLPDKSLGSSWHPWIQNGVPQLPIQEDETALVLIAFHRHYELNHNIELLEELYNPLVEKAANFLVRYRLTSGLPDASYDLWERKRGTSTFTSASVFAALNAAAALSKILGKDTHETTYREAAEAVRAAVLQRLWDDKSGTFANMELASGKIDRTIDISSVYGAFSFGLLAADDPKLARAFEKSVAALSRGMQSGGLARFEDDDYYRITDAAPGNPWVVTTLWYAEYLTATAKTDHDLDRVRDIFVWVEKHAQCSGVLSEQLDPRTGEQVGATPLTWSHAAFVLTVLKYLEKAQQLRK